MSVGLNWDTVKTKDSNCPVNTFLISVSSHLNLHLNLLYYVYLQIECRTSYPLWVWNKGKVYISLIRVLYFDSLFVRGMSYLSFFSRNYFVELLENILERGSLNSKVPRTTMKDFPKHEYFVYPCLPARPGVPVDRRNEHNPVARS